MRPEQKLSERMSLFIRTYGKPARIFCGAIAPPPRRPTGSDEPPTAPARKPCKKKQKCASNPIFDAQNFLLPHGEEKEKTDKAKETSDHEESHAFRPVCVASVARDDVRRRLRRRYAYAHLRRRKSRRKISRHGGDPLGHAGGDTSAFEIESDVAPSSAVIKETTRCKRCGATVSDREYHVTLPSKTVSYDGQKHSLTLEGDALPDGIGTTFVGNEESAAGDHIPYWQASSTKPPAECSKSFFPPS